MKNSCELLSEAGRSGFFEVLGLHFRSYVF